MNIYFTEKNKKEYMKCVDEIISQSRWSEGKYVQLFEKISFEKFGLKSVALSNGGAALYLLYQYIDIRGKDVIVPGNTCWATVAAIKLAGGNVIFADCNREDLCLSYEDMLTKITPNTVAVTVVHVGGHIAFDIEKIADYCEKNGIYLVEDCAHAHGAEWNGKKPGMWGIGGAYSFYATKTLTTGEGGMVVTKYSEVEEYCKLQRNYGKKLIDGKVHFEYLDGFNFRISEFTAALGWIQMKNLEDILEEKRNVARKYDQIFDKHVKFPVGMKSGYYKYIAFDVPLKLGTGKVFAMHDQSSNLCNSAEKFTNCEWVAEHHVCPPIYCGLGFENMNIEEIRNTIL